MKASIRKSNIEDSKFIMSMIHELALFEKAPDQVILTEDQLIRDGFTENKLFESIILECDDVPVGMALFYFRYSTWKGKSLYLEDLIVKSEMRGRGLGKLAFKWPARFAVDNTCHRFEWQVLDWNEPAIGFYKAMGCQLDGEWINCRLEGIEIKDYLQT